MKKILLQEIANFNERRRNAWVAQQAKSCPAGGLILDAGAGPGKYRDLFKHCQYQTQDFGRYAGTADGLMKEQWKYTPLDYQCDITNIPVPDGKFDAVLCTEVLEHLPEPIQAIREFSRILKAGGRLWLTAPSWSGLHQEPYHYYGGFTPHWYRWWLDKHGFADIQIQNNGGFFLWQAQESFRLLGILLERAGWKRWDPRRELSRFVFGRVLPAWLAKMETKIATSEFTVGYFVAAVKK